MNDMPFILPEPPSAEEVRKLRAALWQKGYAPVPIATGDKACYYTDWPARARAGEFADCIFDTTFASTGIECAGLRAIDIDIDDPAVVDAVYTAAKAAGLPGPGAVRYRENTSRVLWLYRTAEGQPGKRLLAGPKWKIEILGRGQQFVCDGLHPTGVPIRWDSDLDFPECLPPLAELPVLTEEQITTFLTAVAPIIESPDEARTADAAAHTPNPEKEAPIADVEAALALIPNPDLSWDAWRAVGLAVWAATSGSGAGCEAWRAWSTKSSKHDDDEIEKAWDEITRSPPDQIGFGSLVHLARETQPGWCPPSWHAAREAGAAAAFANVPLPPDRGAALRPAAPPLPLLFAADIRPVLDTPEIVQGLIAEKTAGVIYGESNSGKTFWTVDLALSVAAGIAWNGRRVERSGVVYAVLEGGNGFRNRVTAWLQEHTVDPTVLPFAAIPSSLNLLDPNTDTSRLIAAVTAAAAGMDVPVRLIVIDTLSRALAGGNENAPDAMGALVTNIDRVRAETGCAVYFIHHSGKDAAKGARGHSLLRAAVDTEIEIADAGGERTASVVKQRDLPKGGVFGFTLKPVPLGVNRHGEPVTSCVVEHIAAAARPAVKTKPLSPQPAIVLARLHAAIAVQGEPLPLGSGFPTSPTRGVKHESWRAAAYDALGLLEAPARRQAFHRAAADLTARGLIETHDGFTWPVAQPERAAFAAPSDTGFPALPVQGGEA